MRFVDTNVLLYAACPGPEDAEKHERADDLLGNADLALSVQTLGEFYWQATRRTRVPNLTHEEARAYVESFRRYQVQEFTLETLNLALDLTNRYQIAYWDAAILAAASLSGCDTLLTEDLGDGQVYGDVRVANPFGS